MQALTNFTLHDLEGMVLPKITESAKLEIHHALSLANSNNGILLEPPSCRISLPFTVEQKTHGFYLRSHFPAYRNEVVDVIANIGTMEVLFDIGEYYVDPSLILRERAHAPTEIKAIFSIAGAARFVDVTRQDALVHLDKVRAIKQSKFNSASNFAVDNLPDDYIDELLPQIKHFEIDIQKIEVYQVMALTHLKPELREHVMKYLEGLNDTKASEAAQIMRYFV